MFPLICCPFDMARHEWNISTYGLYTSSTVIFPMFVIVEVFASADWVYTALMAIFLISSGAARATRIFSFDT